MKKNMVFVVLLFSAITCFSQPIQTEQLVLDLSKKKFEWMVNKRYDSLELLLDDQLKYIHSNGWVQSKKDVLDDFASGKLSYQEIEITESTFRQYDQTAIITGKGKFVGTVNENVFAMGLSYTEIYIKRKNSWFLVSRHANRMP